MSKCYCLYLDAIWRIDRLSTDAVLRRTTGVVVIVVDGLLAVLDMQSHGVSLGPIANIADIVPDYNLVVVVSNSTNVPVEVVVGSVLPWEGIVAADEWSGCSGCVRGYIHEGVVKFMGYDAGLWFEGAGAGRGDYAEELGCAEDAAAVGLVCADVAGIVNAIWRAEYWGCGLE